MCAKYNGDSKVKEFKYLGAVLCKHGKMERKIRERAMKGRCVIGSLAKVMKGRYYIVLGWNREDGSSREEEIEYDGNVVCEEYMWSNTYRLSECMLAFKPCKHKCRFVVYV